MVGNLKRYVISRSVNYPVHTGLFKPLSNRFPCELVSNWFKCHRVHTTRMVNRLRLSPTNIDILYICSYNNVGGVFNTHVAGQNENGFYASVVV